MEYDEDFKKINLNETFDVTIKFRCQKSLRDAFIKSFPDKTGAKVLRDLVYLAIKYKGDFSSLIE